MSAGELVFANVVDQRVLEAQGDEAPAGVYLLNRPGRALPFTIYRAWKVPTGMVREEIRLISPSGRTVYRWGPAPRRMLGSMDLTIERDRIEDAFFEETGTHLASFMIDDEILGEIEVPVYVQEAPAKLPKEVEDGLKRSDVIWVGVDHGGNRTTAPVWFSYKSGRIYVLSRREPGPDEQTVPGLPGAPELVVVTRRKGRDTSLGEFRATVRVLEGPEWEEAAKALADRRRSRVGSPADRIERWRGTCAIAELTPLVPA
ncbi:MAG: hypothetical protein HYU54_10295 [Actinobacteria bacterium]|nr:hypothetical protein [Actinomycetota bacterium]